MQIFLLPILATINFSGNIYFRAPINMKILNKKTADRYVLVSTDMNQIRYFNILLKIYMSIKNEIEKNNEITSILYSYLSKKKEFIFSKGFHSILTYYFKDLQNVTELLILFLHKYYPENLLLEKLLRKISHDIFLIIFIQNFSIEKNVIFFKNKLDILSKLEKNKRPKKIIEILSGACEKYILNNILNMYDKVFQYQLKQKGVNAPKEQVHTYPCSVFFLYKKVKEEYYALKYGYFYYLNMEQKFHKTFNKKYMHNLLRPLIFTSENIFVCTFLTKNYRIFFCDLN